jgi:hypothetical protein
MNYQREMCILIVGIGAFALIYKGEYAQAGTLLGGLIGFILGEKNGIRIASKSE